MQRNAQHNEIELRIKAKAPRIWSNYIDKDPSKKKFKENQIST